MIRVTYFIVCLLLGITLVSCIRDEALNAEADILTCTVPGDILKRDPIIENNKVVLMVTADADFKSRKTKSDGREKRKAIFEAKTKCAQKSRLLPPSGQNTSVVQTPFESCLNDAFLLNFLLKYHLKTHCQFSKKSYLYIVVMLPLCIPSRPHS